MKEGGPEPPRPPDPPPAERGFRPGDLGGLLAAALAIRLILIARTTSIAADGAFYLAAARQMAERGPASALTDYPFHPFFPALTALLGRIFGSYETGAYALSVAASAASVIPFAFLVRRLWSTPAALYAGYVYALHPIFVHETSEVLATGLFLGLFVTSLALAASAFGTGSWVRYLLAGIASGLCYLTRVEGVYLVLLGLGAAGWVGLDALRRTPAAGGPTGAGRRLAGLALAGVMGAATVSPYALWLHRAGGTWIPTGRRAAQDVLKEAPAPASSVPPAAPDRPPPPEALDPSPPAPAPSRAPRPYVSTLFSRLRKAFYGPLLPFLLFGIAAARRQTGTWRPVVVFGGAAFACFLPTAVAFAIDPASRPSHRYLLAGMSLLMPCVGAGFVALGEFLRRFAGAGSSPFRRRAWAAVPALLLVLLLVRAPERRPDEATFLEAGAWLSRQGVAHPRNVLSTTEKIPYYGNLNFISLGLSPGARRWIPAGDGTWAAAPSSSSDESVGDEVRQTTELYRRRLASFLILDGAWLKDEVPPEYLVELGRAGYETVAAFPGSPPGKRIPVQILRRKETPK